VLPTTHPLLVLRSWKSRAIPLPTLWATPGLKWENFTFTFTRHTSTKTFHPKLDIFIHFAMTLLAKHYYSDQIKAAEMGRASSM